ncbi:hypothetical protein AB0I68_13035 [Streptomyces sp. NPDC050448]|uniref:hypothetical protein n=1 Tax=Streptomyces sp. NPDC050448 TaxID=3155404 RepID=UPI0034210C6D
MVVRRRKAVHITSWTRRPCMDSAAVGKRPVKDRARRACLGVNTSRHTSTNGILTVRVPKTAESKQHHRIPITGGDEPTDEQS